MTIALVAFYWVLCGFLTLVVLGPSTRKVDMLDFLVAFAFGGFLMPTLVLSLTLKKVFSI